MNDGRLIIDKSGDRMKIPRIPFLRFLEAEKEEST